MDKIEHFIFKEGLPKKNKFILALMLLRFPLFIPIIKSIIRRNLKHCKNIYFLPGFLYYQGNIHAKNVEFGDAMIMDYAPVYIGEGTTFGWQCMIATGHHDYKNFSTIHAKSVIIGKNVRIYSRTIILGGIKIGDNSVVGAGSVVTKDIPPNCFAAGNPALVVKKLK